MNKLSDATRMDLFPTVQMIQEVSMEFAVPALIEELASKNNCIWFTASLFDLL